MSLLCVGGKRKTNNLCVGTTCRPFPRSADVSSLRSSNSIFTAFGGFLVIQIIIMFWKKYRPIPFIRQAFPSSASILCFSDFSFFTIIYPEILHSCCPCWQSTLLFHRTWHCYNRIDLCSRRMLLAATVKHSKARCSPLHLSYVECFIFYFKKR